MANSSDSTASAPTPLFSSTTKENLTPVAPKSEELNESSSELRRLQGLEKDLQTYLSELHTQAKVYRRYPDELSELKQSLNTEVKQLKQSLNTEVEQLRSEFQELRTLLQQQQDDVTSGLRNIGLQDTKEELSSPKTEVENMK